jgi:hypothetical protein
MHIGERKWSLLPHRKNKRASTPMIRPRTCQISRKTDRIPVSQFLIWDLMSANPIEKTGKKHLKLK